MFFIILFFELIFSPFLYVWEFILKRVSGSAFFIKRFPYPCVNRNEYIGKIVYVSIHDWAGYPGIRTKKIKSSAPFECGLDFQVERFSKYTGPYTLEKYLTLSDYKNSSQENKLNIAGFNQLHVSNVGMDFAGYSKIFNVLNKKEGIIILTNSSVNSIQIDFLDDYVNYYNSNRDVGIMGVSYSTKITQTLIRSNFKPHIQSFFLLTSLDILRKVVKENGGFFPGEKERIKQMIIRNGEVRLSQIVLKLGYSLAIVTENGSVKKIRKQHYFDNCYSSWVLPHGDARLNAFHPNSIIKLNPDSE